MTHDEHKFLIESFGNAPDELEQASKQLPDRLFDYKPAPEKWSIHEILVHIADSEANGFIRIRAAIAEPGKMIMAYNQDGWATALKYSTQSAADALAAFRVLRTMTYNVLRELPEAAWNNTVTHPEHGPMTLEDLLVRFYEPHIRRHIAQFTRNLEQWTAAVSG